MINSTLKKLAIFHLRLVLSMFEDLKLTFCCGLSFQNKSIKKKNFITAVHCNNICNWIEMLLRE